MLKLTDITRYRSHWMGVAILWILLFHSGLDISFAPLSYLRELGYAGVDIFCFASGIGLYCSYTKDHSPLDFLKRRINKLMFVYVVFMLIWSIYKLTVSQASVTMIIGNFLGIQGFAGSDHVFNWYITFLVVTMVLTPCVASVVEHAVKIRKIIAFLALMFLGTVPFWGTDHLILVIRLPLFVLGMLCGKYMLQGYILSKRNVEVLTLVSIGAVVCLFMAFTRLSHYLWDYGLYWYPFFFITPGLCVMMSVVFLCMDRCAWGRRLVMLIGCLGKYTFEIYLIHIFLFDVLTGLETSHILVKDNGTILAAIVLVFPLSLVLHKLSSVLCKYFERRFEL